MKLIIIKFVVCIVILSIITLLKGYACEKYEYDSTISSANAPQHHKLLEKEALKKLNNSSSSSSCNGLQASEYNMVFKVIFKKLFQIRPHHFENLTDLNNEASLQNNNLVVFKRFFDEWVQGGSLDSCVNYLKKIIAEREAISTDIKTDVLGFIDNVSSFFKYLASDDLNDPLKNPIDKYVIQQVEEENLLYQKLEEQVDQQNDNDNEELHRLSKLQNEIGEGRNKAIKEFGNYMFDLLKRISPELSNIQQPDDLTPHMHITTFKKERESLEHYIENEFDSYDEKEPNRLRRFSEVMARNQYNKAFHEMVCESFQEKYQASEIHKKVKSIWHLKLLDTINQNPKEASSRMPGTSIDGSQAGNFGYKMANSKAYQTWLQNPLVLASGDIIMDALHYVAELGSSLDKDQFLKRFDLYLNINDQDQADQLKYYEHPHCYDFFMPAFNLHLLEHTFNKPFIPHGIDNVQTTLIKFANNKENLNKEILKILDLLQKFSEEKIQNFQSGNKKGPVLGIGFNGPLFNSFNTSKSQNNEIWLTFSSKGRDKAGSGHLFLTFVKKIAECKNPSTKFDFNNFLFKKYNMLIEFHLNKNIKFYSKAFDITPTQYCKDSQMQYLNFKAELDKKPEYDNLSANLKDWILNFSNWYMIPNDSIKTMVHIIPENAVSEEEEKMQHDVREILFHAITKRSFLEYFDLYPFLQQHWRKTEGQDLTKDELDEITSNVHQDLSNVWKSEITKIFEEFIDDKQLKDFKNCSISSGFDMNYRYPNKKISYLRNDLRKASSAIDKLKSLKNKNADIQKKVETNTQIKEECEKLLKKLPPEVANLEKNDFLEFKEHFFEERDITQCVEPFFAKILGHEHFLPVSISGQTNQTTIKHPTTKQPLRLGNTWPQDVIEPCGNRCQYHALGHVYIGDINSSHSADQLNNQRQVHGIEGLPNRFSVENFSKLLEQSFFVILDKFKNN